MSLFKRNKNVDVDGNFSSNGRKRKIALTFGVLAVSVGISITWWKKDPETGEKPKMKKEVTITTKPVAIGDSTYIDTLYHFEHQK